MSRALLSLEPFAVGIILAMAIVTYATKAGGLWLVGRLEVTGRTETGLEILPSAIVVSIVAGELLEGGPPEWIGGGAVALVAWYTENFLLALLAGVVTVVLLRGIG